MELEVCYRHFARQKEGNRASEEPEKDQGPAEHLKDIADSNLSHQGSCATIRGHPDREGKELHRANLYEDERSHDAKHASQSWLQGSSTS